MLLSETGHGRTCVKNTARGAAGCRELAPDKRSRGTQMTMPRNAQYAWSSATLAGVMCVALLSAPAAQAQNKPDRETARWWSNVQYMASDKMEGRDTGSAA